MDRFIIHFGGTYSKDICAKRIEVQALNGILFATVKLKQVFLRDRGEETDTGNCALPLHGCQTATKDGAKRYKELFDHLAKEIIEFRCRLLTIDANMSMWAVVPEMRARGVQICLAAWAPWHLEHVPEVHSDSCGIFVIGPFEGIIYAYGAEAFGLDPAFLDDQNQKARFNRVDATGKVAESSEWVVPIYNERGQGYHIRS